MHRLLPVLLILAAAPTAHAEPIQEARSATGACLAAIIDGAPVEDIDGDDAVIRRGKEPVSCTVQVTAGLPVQIRDAMLVAINRRPEKLLPAKTRWAPGEYASREAFCSLTAVKHYLAVVSTGKPGARVTGVATVVETDRRDPRCDRDEGVQTAPAAETKPAPTP